MAVADPKEVEEEDWLPPPPKSIKVGEIVANSKQDPIKLLKLLDIFDGLNKMRPDFNKLFGSKGCFEIQNRTRDLVKMVVEGACQIFWELLTQVELQRQRPANL